MQISNDYDLLRCCARTNPDAASIEQIKVLSGKDINWRGLLKLARFHKLLPLLYLNLKNHGQGQVPDEIFQKLKGYYYQNVLRNLAMFGALAWTLNLLKAQGIMAVPFKGPILAETMYGDLSLRSFSDLDILIFREDTFRTIKLLSANGFVPFQKLNSRQIHKYTASEKEFSLTHLKSGTGIDLQWNVLWGYFKTPLGLDSLKPRLLTVKLAGQEMASLANEDNLLYLCIHGNFHTWERLDLICCVAETLRACPDLDWSYIITTADRLQTRTMLLTGLLLAHDLLNASLPDTILDEIGKSPKIQGLAATVISSFNKPNHLAKNKTISHLFSFWHLKSQDNLMNAIRYSIWVVTFPSIKEWLYLPLPAPLSFLHYFFRPVRLLYEGVMRSFRA
ncbi:MAG: nucleotidyltransferase family protein [Spirochaetales bacterium]|nr:nucleotidyltransferase family protein [Spirochaetales bacterium]